MNVLKSNNNRKVSAEMANVVKDSGEGWYFFVAIYWQTFDEHIVLATKKYCHGATGKRVG